MMVIEISEKKFNKLAENTEKMLRYAGKVMQCIEEMQEAAGGNFGNRGGGGYGNRNYGGQGNFGNRMPMMNGNYGNRYEDDDEDDEDFGERRGVKGTGPYARRYR